MALPDSSIEFALELDRDDDLHDFRARYHIPVDEAGNDLIYLTGNSLGLQPRAARDSVIQELDDWRKWAVEGHFRARYPWFEYHESFSAPESAVVGARAEEVVLMNSLTTNLHLMMVSFYRPTAQRFKIVIEENAFPSDRYAVASQAAFHGFDPEDAIIELKSDGGRETLDTARIVEQLERHGEQIALVMLGAVNYYTGQAFDLEAIAAAAHSVGATVGYDCAHAAGNLPLQLHDSGADFAVWCTYKYLNSGPGGISGCFVHERHAFDLDLPRFAGWWGNDPATRFEMPQRFVPQRGAAGWQLSNAQVFPLALHRAALDLFSEAGMNALRKKSLKLTGYLADLIQERCDDSIEIITPSDPEARGCQLSLRIDGDAKSEVEWLMEQGVVADFRVPDVIRVAPTPMYNTFEDVWRFVDLIASRIA